MGLEDRPTCGPNLWTQIVDPTHSPDLFARFVDPTCGPDSLSLKNKELFRFGLLDRPRMGVVRLVDGSRVDPLKRGGVPNWTHHPPPLIDRF